EDLVKEAKIGETYTGPVTKILDFGAFVELFPGSEGMVHVSEITNKERVMDINKYLKVGQLVTVKVKLIDEKGRVNLTMKGIPQETAPIAQV
ncbi:MAG: S1 RNA-binding domain-containing protein, partial [Patescibacteria group bacterium]